MSLKLFRSTGYSSILGPGETRVAVHPGWIVAATSAWIGFICNVQVWRALAAATADGTTLLQANCLGVFIAAGCALVLSMLGWRVTLKPAATVLLLLAALSASAIWAQGLAVDASLLDKRLSTLLLPPWASFLRWQTPAMMVGLALIPMVWVWHTRVRRLSGPQQLDSNLIGALASGVLLAASGYLMLA